MTRRLPAAIPRMLGVAAGAAVVLAAPFLAVPAYADGLSVTITSPTDGQRITASATVEFDVQVAPVGLPSTIDSVDLGVSKGGTTVVQTTLCTACGSTQTTRTYQKTFTANGTYAVHVSAQGSLILNLSKTDGSADASFTMAVPPPAPTGLTAQRQSDGSVALTWSPVTGIDDLRGYAVFRKIGGGSFTPIAGVVAANYVDRQPPAAGGTVQYQVAAYRNAAVASNDPNTWIASVPSASTTVNLPLPPTTTTAPGSNDTTTLPVGGGLIQGGAASSVPDLGSFFSSNSSAAAAPLPDASPAPTLPDTGFSQTLPFPSTSAPGKILGSQPGRPSSASGTGKLEADKSLSNSNRRALLVPVAAGSVLSVAALHLRWLNRRLAIAPVGRGPGDPEELELDDDEPEPEPFRTVLLRPATPAQDGDRVPVGAGTREF